MDERSYEKSFAEIKLLKIERLLGRQGALLGISDPDAGEWEVWLAVGDNIELRAQAVWPEPEGKR